MERHRKALATQAANQERRRGELQAELGILGLPGTLYLTQPFSGGLDFVQVRPAGAGCAGGRRAPPHDLLSRVRRRTSACCSRHPTCRLHPPDSRSTGAATPRRLLPA